MPKGLKFEEVIPEWIKLYNEGKSFREIAQMYDCNMNTVGRTLKGHVEQRPKSKWDAYGEEWLNLYQNHAYSKSDIARQYQVSSNVVKRVLITMGIDKDTEISSKLKKFSHLVKDFIQDYNAGMSLNDISKKYGVNKQTVYNYLKDEEIPMRKPTESSRKYEVNESYFDEINTKEKAFYLGIIFSIGTTLEVYHGHCLSLNVHISKEKLLKTIVKEILEKEDYSGIKKCNDDILRIRLHSKHLFDRLRELGLSSRKDTILPNLPKDLLSSFLLGYLQDRGSYTSKNHDLMIYGNQLFLEQLRDVLKESLKVDKLYFKDSKNTCLAIYDSNEIKKIEDWLNLSSSTK